MTTEEFHTYQENAFDAFCRSVIRNESIAAHRELATRAAREVSISALTPEVLLALSTEDTYQLYKKTLYVGKHIVHVCNEDLGEVLQTGTLQQPGKKKYKALCHRPEELPLRQYPQGSNWQRNDVQSDSDSHGERLGPLPLFVWMLKAANNANLSDPATVQNLLPWNAPHMCCAK